MLHFYLHIYIYIILYQVQLTRKYIAPSDASGFPLEEEPCDFPLQGATCFLSSEENILSLVIKYTDADREREREKGETK